MEKNWNLVEYICWECTEEKRVHYNNEKKKKKEEEENSLEVSHVNRVPLLKKKKFYIKKTFV